MTHGWICTAPHQSFAVWSSQSNQQRAVWLDLKSLKMWRCLTDLILILLVISLKDQMSLWRFWLWKKLRKLNPDRWISQSPKQKSHFTEIVFSQVWVHPKPAYWSVYGNTSYLIFEMELPELLDIIVTGAIEKEQMSPVVINTANTYPYPTVLLTWYWRIVLLDHISLFLDVTPCSLIKLLLT